VYTTKKSGVVTAEYGPGYRIVTFDDGSTMKLRPSEFRVDAEVAKGSSDDDILLSDETTKVVDEVRSDFNCFSTLLYTNSRLYLQLYCRLKRIKSYAHMKHE
jgi:hypothetical protein